MESQPRGTPGQSEPACDPERGWALHFLLAAALTVAGVLLLKFRGDAPPPDTPPSSASGLAAAHWTPAPRPQGETVILSIDFGNGARREFDALPWSVGMTVGDLLRQTRKFQPAIAFEHDGTGEKAFLTSLEGVTNDDAGGRFWTYEINGADAKVSFDVQPLEPGDRVLWKFSGAE